MISARLTPVIFFTGILYLFYTYFLFLSLLYLPVLAAAPDMLAFSFHIFYRYCLYHFIYKPTSLLSIHSPGSINISLPLFSSYVVLRCCFIQRFTSFFYRYIYLLFPKNTCPRCSSRQVPSQFL